MQRTRRGFNALALGLVAAPSVALAQDDALREALFAQLFGTEDEHLEGLSTIVRRGDPDMAAGLILALRFGNRRHRAIDDALQILCDRIHFGPKGMVEVAAKTFLVYSSVAQKYLFLRPLFERHPSIFLK